MKQLITRYLKPLVIWLAQGIISAILVLFFAYLLAEWASGCGETYTDIKGVVHINECVFSPVRK